MGQGRVTIDVRGWPLGFGRTGLFLYPILDGLLVGPPIYDEEILMTEKVKKTTTPRKTASASAPPKAAPRKRTTTGNVTTIGVSDEEVARLAHRYWTERGGQHGHDAEDWFRAEQELRGKAS
jgi:DUF2934 family protein